MGNHVTKKHAYDGAHLALHKKREKSGKLSMSLDAIRHRAAYWKERETHKRIPAGSEVDHTKPLKEGIDNSITNTRIESIHKNRSDGGKLSHASSTLKKTKKRKPLPIRKVK